jgi:predicted HicB family RNase H-like nuclease
LIPFAVKLNSDLVAQVNALAQQRKVAVNEIVAELLQAALKK